MAKKNGRIENFVSLQGNPKTQGAYRAAVRKYLDFIYGPVRAGRGATKAEAAKYEELASELFSGDRDHVMDMQRFAASLNAAKTPPKSASVWLVVSKEFLRVNGVALDIDEWRVTKRRGPKGKRARSREGVFDRETIREILPHLPYQTRAVFLSMISSGMRVGETQELTFEDIFLDENPARIEIPGDVTKSGDPRTVFISREAVGAIRVWLAVRERWMTSAAERNTGLRRYHGRTNKPRNGAELLFPASSTTILASFANALEKIGKDDRDPKTNRRVYRLHQCRKFFRTVAAQKIPIDAVEALMGHEGYLSDAYVRYTTADLRDFYLQAEPSLLVGTDPEVATMMMGGQIDELRDENVTLRAELAVLQRQVVEVGEAQRATSGYLDQILQDPEGNAEKIRRLKQLLLDS